MNLDIDACEVDTGLNQHQDNLSLQIRGVEARDVLDHFEPKDVVAHFNNEDLLDAIGKDACMAYFDLQEAE